ncbi:MAG: circularly permuted type 2 ATP-grasp protein [Pseudomonadota bacterium]|jgi:uncharacterized circularly permuted ATP-grasp superfamily protein|nr:circularly permuted type 2 ATP-grasp protein [Pseudomonadota bacterium]|tara:strand:- start:5575 stop:6981 length:1407 start_codon:yes stop_codon:yes gene_type:complete
MFNEIYDKKRVRPLYVPIMNWAKSLPESTIIKRKSEAENLFKKIGITFSVYNNYDMSERLIPFDMFPRILSKSEWLKLQKGVEQRALAINAFLNDIYHKGEILKAGIIPKKLIYQNPAYEIKMVGFKVPKKIYSPIIGTDIIRVDKKDFRILEDNCRTPSGVSYMIENREIMMRMFPELFQSLKIEPVENYPEILLDTLKSLTPKKCSKEPNIVILTPGPLNSAYYEHSFLADMMGVELVQGSDLYVDNGITYMKTTKGKEKVDIIYRRIDDQFIDPITFNKDSCIGVAGLFDSYKAGNVNICSAPGSGIADDKAVYTYMPQIIKFYLGENPVIDNIETWRCSEKKDLQHVLKNIKNLVVKEVHGSGGYGMLIGSQANIKQINAFKKKITENPDNYIAQPIISLSTVPIFKKKELSPRHVDLRPFCLVGNNKLNLISGALTRVALKEGSLIVNSSQGGGVKDTWVLAE